MPRKVRTPKAQIGALPAPAMMYTLMTGQGIPTRMHGWVALMQAGQYGEPTEEQAWALYGETLIEVAAEAGFEPFWVTKRAPKQTPAFKQWRTDFIAAHSY